MSNPVLPGQRMPISATANCHIRLRGPEAARIAVAAIGTDQRIRAFDRQGSEEWFLEGMAELEGDFEVVAYVMDDRHGGFANAAYPIEMEIDGQKHALPQPGQELAAVILAEVYTKDGTRRLKVSNDGFTFGIDAYARARNITGVDIPYRNTPTPPPGHPGGLGGGGSSGGPPPMPGQTLGTGSGVTIGPELIVTNAHVIEGGSTFEIGRGKVKAVTLAVDPLHDLALLQCPSLGNPLPLRLNAPIWLGEDVMAAGFPLMDVLGADLKVTTGNVSGLTGGMGDVSRFQFTAPIGSGSSGGAIIDEFGNLIGITSASLAHQNFRDRGAISENVNFGIRAALVFEMVAAAGVSLPQLAPATSGARRDVVNLVRNSVVSIAVIA